MVMVNMFVNQCVMLVGQELSQVAVGLVLGQAERTVEAWEGLVRERQRTAHLRRMEPLLKTLIDQRTAELRAELEADHRARLSLVQLHKRTQDKRELEQIERLHARHEAARASTLLTLEQLERQRLDYL